MIGDGESGSVLIHCNAQMSGDGESGGVHPLQCVNGAGQWRVWQCIR